MSGHIDVGRLRQRSAYIEAQLEALRRRTADPKAREELLSDTFASGAVKYALQTAVEAVIDMAYHLAVQLCGTAPGSAVEAFQALAGQGYMNAEDAARFAAMARVRDKVVHGYGDVTIEGLARILEEDLQDFERWLDVVRRIVLEQRGPVSGNGSGE